MTTRSMVQGFSSPKELTVQVGVAHLSNVPLSWVALTQQLPRRRATRFPEAENVEFMEHRECALADSLQT